MKTSSVLLLLLLVGRKAAAAAAADIVTIKRVVEVGNAIKPNFWGLGLDIDDITFDRLELRAGDSIIFEIWFDHCVKTTPNPSRSGEIMSWSVNGATPGILNRANPFPGQPSHITDWEWEFLMTSGDVYETKIFAETSSNPPDDPPGPNRYILVTQDTQYDGRLISSPWVELVNRNRSFPQNSVTFCGFKLSITIPDTVTTYWDPTSFAFEYSSQRLRLAAATSSSTPGPTGSTPAPSSSTPGPTGSTPAPSSSTPGPTGSTPATVTGKIWDDPHFVTFSGEKFDYQGGCDLVMVNTPGFADDMGLDIHVRTTVRYDYSFIESAVLRIGNSTLEVSSWGEYALNGVSSAVMPNMLSGFTISHYGPIDDPINRHVFVVDLSEQEEEEESITIKTYKDFVSVAIKASSSKNWITSSGIMGSFPSGDHLTRNGQRLLNLNHNDDTVNPDAIATEWQVRHPDDPKLFSMNRDPQYPETCYVPSSSSTAAFEEAASALRRRLGESIIVGRTKALRACAHWGNDIEECIHDVMATGDMDLAKQGPPFSRQGRT